MEMYGGPVNERVVAETKAQNINIIGELTETRQILGETHLMILDIIKKLYGDELKPNEVPEYGNVAGMVAANRTIAQMNMQMLKALIERLAP